MKILKRRGAFCGSFTMKIKTEAKKAAHRLVQQKIRQGYKFSSLHEYTDKGGNPAYWRVRLDHPLDGKYIRPLSYVDGEWVLKEPKFKNGKPLYRLLGVLLDSESDVWIVEGEKCADSLVELGLVTITSGSSSSAESADWSPLAGRNGIIWPDNDEAGRNHMKSIASRLQKLGTNNIRVVRWIDAPKGGDCVDAINADVDVLKLISESEEFHRGISIVLSEKNQNEVLRLKVSNVVQMRLDELTPGMVKDIVEGMIAEHLGWLVVWGGVFGGLIGLLSSYVFELKLFFV